ncbi:hypothetical protein RJT34_03542 [Clitoria ternatea]|uniref:Uncharacterized protein n=1 Tax=Clitoria ternatea TaxID=43366 RepID=A0AAN9KJ66_CLITE
MEHEAVFNLFDSFWFELNIFKKNSTFDTSIKSSAENLDYHEIQQQEEESLEEPKLPRIQTSHTISMSDQSMTSFNNDSLSPDSVLLHPKLQTILSGKEVTDSEYAENTTPIRHERDVLLLPKKKQNNIIMTKKGRECKSLSDLEFEELKGFMDLGFVFSEKDKDSSLASIIPGLQRLGKNEEEKEGDCDDWSVVPRPYLSEAWEVHEYGRRKKENPLMHWKIPALNNETDMKESLRWWAHTVASTVR